MRKKTPVRAPTAKRMHDALRSMVPDGEDMVSVLLPLFSQGPGAAPSKPVLAKELAAKRWFTAQRMIQLCRGLNTVPDWVLMSAMPVNRLVMKSLISLVIDNRHLDQKTGIFKFLKDHLEACGIKVTATAVSYWFTGQTRPTQEAFEAIITCLSGDPEGLRKDFQAAVRKQQQRARTKPSAAEDPSAVARRTPGPRKESAKSPSRKEPARDDPIGKIPVHDSAFCRAMIQLGQRSMMPIALIRNRLETGPGPGPTEEIVRRELSGELPMSLVRLLQIIRATGVIPGGFLASEGGVLADEATTVCLAMARDRTIGPKTNYRKWISAYLESFGRQVPAEKVDDWLSGLILAGATPVSGLSEKSSPQLEPSGASVMLKASPIVVEAVSQALPKTTKEANVSSASHLRANLAMLLKAPETTAGLVPRLQRKIFEEGRLRLDNIILKAWLDGKVEPAPVEWHMLAMALRCQPSFLQGQARYRACDYTRPERVALFADLSRRAENAYGFFTQVIMYGFDPTRPPPDPMDRIRLASCYRGNLPGFDRSIDVFPALRYLIGLRVSEDDPWLHGLEPPPPALLQELGEICSVEEPWMMGSGISGLTLITHGIIPSLQKIHGRFIR